MPLELIGNEELPNLYIKSIAITGRQVRITTSFYDYIDSEGKPLYLTEEFINEPFVNVNMILSRQGSDLDATLNSTSDYSLYELKQGVKKSQIFSPVSDDDNDRLHERSLTSLKHLIDSAIQGASPEQYIEVNWLSFFNIDENIEILEEFSTLRCHAFFSFDVANEQNESFLDITNPRDEKMLHGPIFSETIISNGRLKVKTTQFTIDGIGYPGPLHFHEGRYMEGSLHSDKPHRNVDATVVPNYKLEVFREPVRVLKSGTPFIGSFGPQKYFTNPIVSVARKRIYGFFKFKTDKFFQDLEPYRYFSGSTINLNVFKIRDQIKLKINGDKIRIHEILVNHKQDNDMYFYFTKSFEYYEETDFNFEFLVVSPNSFFRNVMETIRDEAKSALQDMLRLSENNSGMYVNVTDPSPVLNFLKKYIGIVSMLRNVEQKDLVALKEMSMLSLYKPSFSKEILEKFTTSMADHIVKLSVLVNSSTLQSDQAKKQNATISMNLQNYRSALNYLGPQQIADPDVISNYLRKTNGEIGKSGEGLFEGREQMLLPVSVRNKTTDRLVDINYASLFQNIGDVFSDTRRTEGLNELDRSIEYGEHVSEEQIKPFASNTSANTSLSQNTASTATGLGASAFNQAQAEAQEEEAQEIANQAQEAIEAMTGISISGDDIVPCGDVRRDIYDADGNYVTTVTDIAVDCDFDGVADSPGGSTTTRAEKLAALNNNGGN